MQIILLTDIANLGHKDDVINVKPGYGRNYLIPQGYAILATEAAKKIVAENTKQRAHKEAKLKAEAEELAAKLAELKLTVGAKTSSTGKIFGSVNNIMISEALLAQGFDIDRKKIMLKEIKEVNRARLTEYKKYRPNSEYHEGKGVWSVKVDIALPCATQNELHLEDAEMLVANGCMAVAEGANMPTTMEATEYLQENGVLFAPGKAANAGGVATSALEMSQNSQRLSWTREEVDHKLKTIMANIHANAVAHAQEYSSDKSFTNYVTGANIAGFVKVADSMIDQGVV